MALYYWNKYNNSSRIVKRVKTDFNWSKVGPIQTRGYSSYKVILDAKGEPSAFTNAGTYIDGNWNQLVYDFLTDGSGLTSIMNEYQPLGSGVFDVHKHYIVGETVNERGSLIGTIQADYSAYTDNARNADGFWYVRGAIVNTAPNYTQIPTQNVKKNTTATVALGNYFSDAEGNPLTYTTSSNNNNIATVSISGSTLTVTGKAIGTATITVTASDGSLSTSQTFNVVVANTAPNFSQIPTQSTKKDVSITVNLANYFSDPDGDTLSYTASSNNTNIATVSISGSNLVLTGKSMGSVIITVTANDGKQSTSQTFTLNITNTAPTVSVIEPKGNLSDLAIIDTLSPVFVWTFQDTDVGDVQSAYQVLIYDTNNQLIHDSSKKTGTASYYTVPENILQWGVRYKWQVRVFDRYDVASEYSFQEFFLPNRAPMATDLSPGSNDAENPAGTGVSPEFTWTFTDLDLEAQASYQLKIYKTTDNSLVYNSNRIYQNVQRHQIPVGALESGKAYYAILDVWDPNGLTAQTQKAYFQTNATPSTPVLTLPVDNYRVSAKPTLQAIVGKDPEGDKQHFVIQIAKDALFTQDLLEFASNVNRTGWKVGGVDIPQTGVSNSAEGQTVAYTLQVNLNKWTTMFWRIAAIDATTNARGVWSNSRRIRVGNVLDYDTLAKPIYTGAVAARRILIALNYAMAQDGAIPADIKVFVTNNGGDASPTWEDATNKFISQDYYEFTNTNKTSTNFAVAFRVVINSNDSMGEIWIDGAGMTFD